MECFRPSWGVWLACLAAAALNWCLDAVVLVMGLLTVGGPVPWRGVLLCYAAAQLLVELPITPGGLGLVEGGLVEVLIRFHVAASRATAATLVYRAVSYWFLLLVGWAAASWLAVRNRQADRAAAAAAAAASTCGGEGRSGPGGRAGLTRGRRRGYMSFSEICRHMLTLSAYDDKNAKREHTALVRPTVSPGRPTTGRPAVRAGDVCGHGG